MIRVDFVDVDLNGNDISVRSSKEFPDCWSRFDREINNYVYEKVLALDIIYNFIDYEKLQFYIEIRYYDNRGKLVYTDDCVDYMYNI